MSNEVTNSNISVGPKNNTGSFNPTVKSGFPSMTAKALNAAGTAMIDLVIYMKVVTDSWTANEGTYTMGKDTLKTYLAVWSPGKADDYHPYEDEEGIKHEAARVNFSSLSISNLGEYTTGAAWRIQSGTNISIPAKTLCGATEDNPIKIAYLDTSPVLTNNTTSSKSYTMGCNIRCNYYTNIDATVIEFNTLTQNNRYTYKTRKVTSHYNNLDEYLIGDNTTVGNKSYTAGASTWYGKTITLPEPSTITSTNAKDNTGSISVKYFVDNVEKHKETATTNYSLYGTANGWYYPSSDGKKADSANKAFGATSPALTNWYSIYKESEDRRNCFYLKWTNSNTYGNHTTTTLTMPNLPVNEGYHWNGGITTTIGGTTHTITTEVPSSGSTFTLGSNSSTLLDGLSTINLNLTTAPKAYTVNFIPDSKSTIASKTVYYNGTFGELETPTKDRHNFLGWYLLNDMNRQVTSSTKVEDITKIVGVSAPYITLQAKWELIPDSYVNINGVWKPILSKYIYIDGTWKEIDKFWYRDGKEWKKQY